MSSSTNITGCIGRGGDVPWINPHEVVIAGVDEPLTDETWFAFCPRLEQRVAPDDKLLHDIRQNGVLRPIEGCRDGKRLLLLAGRRRTLRARIVWDEEKRRRVPDKENKGGLRFLVRDGEPDELFAFNVSENERENLTALQRAQLLRHGLRHMHGTEAENIAALAEREEVVPATIKNRLAILDCHPVVQAAISTGQIPETAAKEFAAMPKADQGKKLEELVSKGITKGGALKQGLRAAREGKSAADGGNVIRVRSRVFWERFRDEAYPDAAIREHAKIAWALARYHLGDDTALDKLPSLKAMAERAGGDKRKKTSDEAGGE